MDKQAESIKKVVQNIFTPLEDKVKKLGFMICSHANYNQIKISIFSNYNEPDEQIIKVSSLDISKIKGKRDENFNDVINLTFAPKSKQFTSYIS